MLESFLHHPLMIFIFILNYLPSLFFPIYKKLIKIKFNYLLEFINFILMFIDQNIIDVD